MAHQVHSALVSGPNWDPPDLRFQPLSCRFSAEDGLGPLDSLHQAGDATAVVSEWHANGIVSVGSAVMVAPGLLLTATHVLHDLSARSATPVFCTFLPDGRSRVWGACESNHLAATTVHGLKSLPRNSDVSLVSCVLISEAHADVPVGYAPIQVCLPRPGERVWAVGFRQEQADGQLAGPVPIVSSGLVTERYPQGRGRLLPSPCIEVAMSTLGGMSGGPVYNEQGWLVGIVSRSLECEDGRGPTYVTLVWDALRFGVHAPWPRGAWPDGVADLFVARDLSLARIEGRFARDQQGHVRIVDEGGQFELPEWAPPQRSVNSG